jgi:hypothetical protein
VVPRLEELECRWVMATLLVYGTAGDDYIPVNNLPAGVDRVEVYCYAGNDLVDAQGVTVPLLIYGGHGNDVIYGGESNDLIYGGPETDTLYGKGGVDWLDAGSATEAVHSGWRAHTQVIGGTNPEDVSQTAAPACAFDAALISVTARGGDFTGRVRFVQPNVYGVTLFHPEQRVWFEQLVYFNGTVYESDPETEVEGEYWPLLFQRAHLVFNGVNPADINAVRAWGGDYLHRALMSVVGRESDYVYTAGISPQTIANEMAAGLFITTATYVNATSPYLVANHAYAFQQLYILNGGWRVVVRNPWREDGGALTQGADDGIVDLDWGTFVANFWHYAKA